MAKIPSRLVSEKRVHCGVTAPPQYLSGLDIFHSYAYFPLVLVYRNGLDPQRVERALVQTLRHYPIICGRFRKDGEGHVFADINDAGVDLRMHRWDGPLPYGEGRPLGKDIARLYRTTYPWRVVDRDTPFLQVNIHQFEDGASILCCYGPHALLDASSYWAFMLEWAKASHGMPVYTPSFDRQPLIDAGRDGAHAGVFDLVTAPRWTTMAAAFARLGWRAAFGMTSGLLRVPAATIAQWKADKGPDAVAATAKDPSAASLVSLYVLRAISPVLPRGSDRSLGLVRDLRYTEGTGIPRDYFGNAVCYAEARFQPDELEGGHLRSLAQRCKPDAAQVGAPAVLKMLALMERYRQKKANWRLLFRPTLETLKAGVIVNNCVLLPIYDIDLGTGAPDWYEMPPATIRLLLLVPSPRRDGSIDLMLCGHRREVEALRRRFEADGIDARIRVPAPSAAEPEVAKAA